ncbi:MAG: hypothetical protein FWG25_04640, partial [Promicromonosporaceae bacterium]|nr:hypothetical protein [Promicromonosporaceae bacterium]
MNVVKRAAVLGHPIAHSLSPVLHNAAYAALGLTDWEYDAIDVESSGLADLLNSTLLERDDYVGFSLTMPLKVEVLRWLAALGLARESAARPPVIVDPLCEISGAANTLVKRSLGTDAELSAFNTDVGGIVAAIREVIRHGPVESVGILGAGATAASALAAAVEL